MNMSTKTKLAIASGVSLAIYVLGRKRFGDEDAATAAVVYGLLAGAYIAKPAPPA